MKKSGLSYGEILKIATRNIYKENSRIKKASTLNINPFDSINVNDDNILGEGIVSDLLNKARSRYKKFIKTNRLGKSYNKKNIINRFESFEDDFSIESLNFVKGRVPTKQYIDKIAKAYDIALDDPKLKTKSIRNDEKEIVDIIMHNVSDYLGIRTDFLDKIFETEKYTYSKKDKSLLIKYATGSIYSGEVVMGNFALHELYSDRMTEIADKLVEKLVKLYGEKDTYDSIRYISMNTTDLLFQDIENPLCKIMDISIEVMTKTMDNKDLNEFNDPFESINISEDNNLDEGKTFDYIKKNIKNVFSKKKKDDGENNPFNQIEI